MSFIHFEIYIPLHNIPQYIIIELSHFTNKELRSTQGKKNVKWILEKEAINTNFGL